jgi:hypothetical protein
MTEAETTAITGSISQSDIARRAFELYCSRGGQHGSDVEDWLQAERELSSAVPSRRRSTRKAAPLD